MIYRSLGSLGEATPALGFGTMSLGGNSVRKVSTDDDSVRLLQTAMSLGIKLFDCAEAYGEGHSEELLGKAIRGRRDEVLVATKFAPANGGFKDLVAAAEASLRRLNTDFIDLYQTHWPNPRIPLEQTVRALEHLVRDSKVRAVGLSNVTLSETRNILELLSAGFPLVSMQQEYNVQERFVERGLLPFCRQNGWAFIAYSPLGRGRLACTETSGALLAEMASGYGVTPAQLALRWVLEQDSVFAIPMTSKISHLKDNIAAVDFEIDLSDLDRLSRIFKPDIREIAVQDIEVAASYTGKVFRSLEEARANSLGVSPSPIELVEALKGGDMLKPVKVRPGRDGGGRFTLFEGQLRYWAWCIAFDGERPITAMIVQTDRQDM